MLDALFLALIAAFSLLSWALIVLCERLVPTLRVGTYVGTLRVECQHLCNAHVLLPCRWWDVCVARFAVRDAERPDVRSHAERGNEWVVQDIYQRMMTSVAAVNKP